MKALWFPPAVIRPVVSRCLTSHRTAQAVALLLICAFACVFAAGRCAGVTIHVPADQPTIQTGIDAASHGDTVLVASGRYFEHDLEMKSGVCLRSESGSAESVTIDAQWLGRVLHCTQLDASTRIEGFTITGGYLADGYGGGIYCELSDIAITRCVLEGNNGFSGGGGIYCARSSPVISECVFSHNGRSVDGGGLYCTAYSSPTVSWCVFWANSAMFWGGAIFCSASSPRIVQCTIAGNSTQAEGAGLWCVYRSHPVFENTIIAFSTQGEGIYVAESSWNDQSDVTISCSDVYGNEGGNYGGVMTDQTGVNGNISDDPRFCDEIPGDFHLYAGSPCLPPYNLCHVQMGALGQSCGDPTDVTSATPGESLNWRFVNPTGPGCRVELDLPYLQPVSLAIYDASGRLVRQLLRAASCPAGRSSVVWDGRSDAGIAAGPGLYFFRLEAGGQVETRKAIHLWR